MQFPHAKAPYQLDRHTVLPWLHEVLATLARADCADFHVETVAPAGVPIEICFDDPEIAPTYCGRLTGWGTDAAPVARHFVLTGRHPAFANVPEWADHDFSAGDFNRLLEGSGLKASFQDRNWRVFDPSRGLGAQISLREGQLRPWHAGLLLIDWTVHAHDLALTHVGTLGLGGRGLLLVGESGAGKSGATLAGLAEGLETVGDDFVALRCDGVPLARSVFPYGRQDPAGLDRIAGLRERVPAHRINHLGKFEFDLRETFPGAFLDELPIEAIVLPQRANAETPRFRPVGAPKAMVELLRSNPFRYVGSPQSRMARFAALVRQVPCYRLELSPDGRQNGRALRALLETLPGREQAVA